MLKAVSLKCWNNSFHNCLALDLANVSSKILSSAEQSIQRSERPMQKRLLGNVGNNVLQRIISSSVIG